MTKLILVAVVVLIALADPARADSNRTVSLTIYNDDLALINEERMMQLPAGQGSVDFPDVCQTIEASSLQVRSLTEPDKFTVLDMNYEYDLIGMQTLLNRYVGKKLKVLLPHHYVENARELKDATLLANNDQPVFQTSDGVYVGKHDGVLFPEIPKGLRSRPTLNWLVRNQGPERQTIAVSYLASGLAWNADYVLELAPGGESGQEQGALAGWVTLNNQAGMAFKNAGLKLVAGDVRQPPPGGGRRGAPTDAVMAMAPPPMAEKSFFEYHLYSLDRKIDLADKQTKQIGLLQAPSFGLTRELESTYAYDWNPHPPDPLLQDVKVFLRFDNSEKNGLGMPLPKGVVRVYQQDDDKSLVFLGEDRIDHTPKNAELRLALGKAFDLQVKRRLVNSRQIAPHAAILAWDIEIVNGKDKPQRLALEDSIYGEWKILKASCEFTKKNARTVRFELEVPPSDKAKTIVHYEVETKQ